MKSLGSVAKLYRYPVKSMQGEGCSQLEVSHAGVIGDRRWALVDSQTQKVVSAKYPHRWKLVLQCRAQTDSHAADTLPFIVILPSGRIVRGTSDQISRVVSDLLNRPVDLCQVPSRTSTMDIDHRLAFGPLSFTVRLRFPVGSASPVPSFVDYAPIHVLSTGTLARLARHYPAGDWSVARFRPNLLLEHTHESDDLEHRWIGQVVRIGEQVRLRIIDPCPRCVMTTLPQGALPEDSKIWSALSRMPKVTSLRFRPGKPLKAVAGVYAEVVTPGQVRLRDEIWLEDEEK